MGRSRLTNAVTPIAVLCGVLALVSTIPAPAAGRAQEGAPATDFDVPDPSECIVEPRPLAFYEQLVATPAARTSQVEATPQPTELGDGEPADAETVAAVNEITRQSIACLNAGDQLRFAATYTENYFRIGGLDEDDLDRLGADPVPVPPAERLPFTPLQEIHVLPDGRVGAY